ncbi:Protein kinase family protein [Quillaja saponaria]|uniref:Protein kinase family protein n=1 Tax=Quillaja saponaria TaxID=32244 RepID=A0AAD7PCV6_QUISA|nr:Protein kinase family protein [Quillaja saponaria]
MVVVLLSCTMSAIAVKQCQDCGHTQVPYPLSTRPDCGDQSYKIRCVSGTLFFDALNSSSYPVTSINPITQRLIVRPPGFLKNECVSEDFKSEGIQLDTNLPFNITSSNSVVLMNCSTQVYETSLICTPSNLCYKYIKGNAIANKDCGPSSHASSICCSIKTGGSGTAYKIRLRKDRCAAYLSFVYLDETLPVNKWPEPGVEIEWKQPKEPVCNVPVDCRDLAHSACSPDPVSGGFIKRCLCNSGFQWDAINGMCHSLAFAAVMLIISGILIKILVSKKRHRIKREAQQSLTRVREDILNAHNSGKSAKIFTGKDITRATNNFSKDNLLGAGGFGEVFKAILDDGTITAVKRAKVGNIKGIDQILNEVRILCQVNHRSLVRLLGCCVELQQPLLIYEYVPNGTLFDHLHGIRFP